MKTLVLEAFEETPLASSHFVLTLLFGWVKMRCNKLESIQSCEFWQELNKMEGDRYDERAKDDMSLPPPPNPSPADGHAACQLFVTQCTHREVQSWRRTRSKIILSLATLLLFQSTYSVGVCTCIRYMEMSVHTNAHIDMGLHKQFTPSMCGRWPPPHVTCDQYVHIGL